MFIPKHAMEAWHWGEVEQKAHEDAIPAFVSHSVFAHHDLSKPLVISCGALLVGLGCVVTPN